MHRVVSQSVADVDRAGGIIDRDVTEQFGGGIRAEPARPLDNAPVDACADAYADPNTAAGSDGVTHASAP